MKWTVTSGALLAGLAQLGCGETVAAGATRVLGTDPSTLRQRPVCFGASSETLGLLERAQESRILSICETAAVRQGTVVVPVSRGGCLVASIGFSSSATGAREGECTRSWEGVTCSSTGIQRKTIHVALRNGASGPVIAETSAAIHSTHDNFTEKSYFALCSAAFRKYPEPLSAALFDAPVE